MTRNNQSTRAPSSGIAHPGRRTMQQSAMELPRDEESFLSDEDDEDASSLDYEDHVAIGGDG